MASTASGRRAGGVLVGRQLDHVIEAEFALHLGHRLARLVRHDLKDVRWDDVSQHEASFATEFQHPR